jgi:hypothetical protein
VESSNKENVYFFNGGAYVTVGEYILYGKDVDNAGDGEGCGIGQILSITRDRRDIPKAELRKCASSSPGENGKAGRMALVRIMDVCSMANRNLDVFAYSNIPSNFGGGCIEKQTCLVSTVKSRPSYLHRCRLNPWEFLRVGKKYFTVKGFFFFFFLVIFFLLLPVNHPPLFLLLSNIITSFDFVILVATYNNKQPYSTCFSYNGSHSKTF